MWCRNIVLMIDIRTGGVEASEPASVERRGTRLPSNGSSEFALAQKAFIKAQVARLAPLGSPEHKAGNACLMRAGGI